jgi:hypothetical protein
MTQEEANKAAQVLDGIAKRDGCTTKDWIALAEDTLRSVLPPESRLLGRLNSVETEVDISLKSRESVENVTTQASAAQPSKDDQSATKKRHWRRGTKSWLELPASS